MEPAALSAIASLRDTEAAGARHGGRAPTIRVEVTTAAASCPPGCRTWTGMAFSDRLSTAGRLSPAEALFRRGSPTNVRWFSDYPAAGQLPRAIAVGAGRR